MIDALPSLKAATGISGKDIVAYLTAKGWSSRPSKVEGVVILSKEMPETEERAELIIPIKVGHSDEQRRVADALRMVAQIEDCSEDQVADRVWQFTNTGLGLAELDVIADARAAELADVIVEKDETVHVYQMKTHSKANEYIELTAQRLRSILGISDQSVFNIVEFLENDVPKVIRDFRLEVARGKVDDIYSTSVPPRIVAAEAICDLARGGDARARLTFAHELGHLLLHARSQYANFVPRHKPMRNQTAESEAHKFALALLIPLSVARGFNDPKLLSLYCQVNQKAAEARMRDAAAVTKLAAIRGTSGPKITEH
jgi:hypothetical protein